ncbi:SDR family NAD(P)-dependent oxidoreductase [Thermodesulfobacteriota bacterium]
MKLNGKIAIITGASRGLGKAMALELARAGASVAVAARTVRRGQSKLSGTIYETVNEIEKTGGTAMPVRCDVTDETEVAEMVEKVLSRFGRVDIMVNNAGVTTPEPFLDLSIKKWDLVTAVNLRGTFLCSKAVLPPMVEQQSGHIVNLSSILAKTVRYSIPYGATKAAIERFTLGLAKEMRRYNIAVNALQPDFTVTEAVLEYRKGIDVTGWQKPDMWGKYLVLIAGQSAADLTGKILDESTLRDLFGTV